MGWDGLVPLAAWNCFFVFQIFCFVFFFLSAAGTLVGLESGINFTPKVALAVGYLCSFVLNPRMAATPTNVTKKRCDMLWFPPLHPNIIID